MDAARTVVAVDTAAAADLDLDHLSILPSARLEGNQADNPVVVAAARKGRTVVDASVLRLGYCTAVVVDLTCLVDAVGRETCRAQVDV